MNNCIDTTSPRGIVLQQVQKLRERNTRKEKDEPKKKKEKIDEGEKNKRKKRGQIETKGQTAIKLKSSTSAIPFSPFPYYAVTLTSPNPFKTARLQLVQ